MKEITSICLVKGAERYILLIEAGREGDAYQALGRWASDDSLSFTWYDAAVLCQRIRAGEPPPFITPNCRCHRKPKPQ